MPSRTGEVDATREPRTPSPRFLVRLGWLLLLWCGGVAAVALVALLIRVLMAAAGLHR